MGFFTYRGLFGCHPLWWPTARVVYSDADGLKSMRMPVGNACKCVKIYGGRVEI